MPDISEADLANYQRVHKFVANAMNNPTTRRKVQEIQKALDPNSVVPELDAAAPIMAEVDELRKGLTTLTDSINKDRDDRKAGESLANLKTQFEKGRASLRAAGYTPEAIEKIEKIMEEKGVADHDVAASHFDKLNPAPAPVVGGGNRFEIFQESARTDERLKPLFDGHEEVFLNREIGATLRDLRGLA